MSQYKKRSGRGSSQNGSGILFQSLRSLLLADVVDQVFIDLRELLWQDVKEIIGDVALDHNLIIPGDTATAGELAGEEF